MKYIVTVLDDKEVIFVFPRCVDHDRFAEGVEGIRFGSARHWERKLRGGEILAAGFVDGGVCHGTSETLGISSRGDVDTALLRAGGYLNR